MTTEYLLNEQMEHVLSALTPSNRLVMRVCLHTGLRVGDVLALRTEQLLTPQFWITEQKTGKRRRVNLTNELFEQLRDAAGPEWVFTSRCDRTKHRTRQAVWTDVKRAAKAFRLEQNVGTHSARKVYAVDLMQKYGDIDRVRRALNHSSESVTLLYAMADMRLRAKYRKKRRRPRIYTSDGGSIEKTLDERRFLRYSETEKGGRGIPHAERPSFSRARNAAKPSFCCRSGSGPFFFENPNATK